MTSRNMKVNESRPMFRSVVLGTDNPPLRQQMPTTGSVVPRPSSIAGRRISCIHSQSTPRNHISANINNSIINSKSNNTYNFKPTELRPVPFYYPIEKTSKVVEEDNTKSAGLLLSTVASRITNCMRILSVQTVYDNKNARASLTTTEGVQMQLSLWDKSSKREKNSNKKQILVELQRRGGDCMTFHQYCRKILNFVTTAAGDNIEGPVMNSDGKRKISSDAEQPKAKKRVLSTKTATAAAMKEEEEYENIIVALEIAHSLLTKDRLDAKQLGLESLCFLTDPDDSGVSASAKFVASQAVLFGTAKAPENKKLTSGTQVFQEIKEIISSLITAAASEQEEEAKSRNLALTIFANALNVTELAKSSYNQMSVFKGDDTYDSVITTLVEELSHTENLPPHTAYLSTKCLRLLCDSTNDNIQQKVLLRLGGVGEKYDIVHRALDVGVRTHQKLELECRKFLEDILLPSN